MIIVRRGDDGDESTCAELWARAVQARDGVPTPDAVRRRAVEKLGRRPRELWVASTPDGRIVGYVLALVEEQAVHLSHLAVDPEFQGSGLAGRLLDHAERGAAVFAPRMTLRVLADNQAARALYERRGWTVVQRGHFADTGRPNLTYDLALGGR